MQFERDFAKPADVRANPAAALAAGDFGWWLVEIRVVKRRAAASAATALEQLSVHVNDVSRACLLVKVVHVLGAGEKALLQRVFKFRQGEVSWIRFGCRSNTPTHGIELPHQSRITVPSFGRSDLLDPVISPEATHTTESWNAAFRTYSCSGKNKDAVSGGNCEHGRTTAKLTAFCHFSRGLGSGLVHFLAGSFLFLDLVWMAIYPFFQLFSLPL